MSTFLLSVSQNSITSWPQAQRENVFFVVHKKRHTDSPDQSLDSKSDNSGEQEERGDQDVEQRQSGEGLRRTGTGFIEEVMHHKRLQDKILNLTIPSLAQIVFEGFASS